jgi:hypothetical protein
MNKIRTQLLKEIDAFLIASGKGESSIGNSINGDGHLVKALRNGRSITIDTADKIREFIKSNMPEVSEKSLHREGEVMQDE